MEELQIFETNIESIKLTKSNLSCSCRLCLTENNVQPLFKLCFDGLSISNICIQLTSLQIKADDNLPQHICVRCIEKLITTYEFIRKCQKIDDLLHSFLDEKQEEITQDIADNKSLAVVQNQNSEENCEIQEKTIEDCNNPEEQNLDINVTENCQVEFNEEVDNTLVKYEILTEDNDNNEKQLEADNIIIELCQEVEENYLDSNNVKENQSKSIPKFDSNSPELVGHPYKCSRCENSYDSPVEFNKHCRKSYKCKPLKYSCKNCGKKFKEMAKLKVHERIHTNEKPYECDICNKKFNIVQNLERHKRMHTGEKPFLCEICGKRFTRLITKEEHMRIHTGHRPHNCKICSKNFFRLRDFTLHMRSHECDGDGKTLKCPHCPKTYVTYKMFSLHLKNHLLNKPKQQKSEEDVKKKYLCNLCGKTFSTTGNLKTHLSMHSGSLKYSCAICNKRFCYKSSIAKHVLIHTGERPYSCSSCDKKFVQSIHLRQHLRVHTGERPYTCDVCGKSFSLSCNLNVHRRVHTGETPYKCKFCDKRFHDSSSMKKHQKVHGSAKTQIQSEYSV